MTSRASLCSPHAEYYAAGILHLFFVVWLEQILNARAYSRYRCNIGVANPRGMKVGSSHLLPPRAFARGSRHNTARRRRRGCMDKRTLAATGLLLWAGALQAHMWSLTSGEEYKNSSIARAGEGTSWTVSLFGSSGKRGEGGE